jgi:hypothetical protein
VLFVIKKHVTERDLTMAIWTHLEERGIVKSTPQDSMGTFAKHCELFAQLITVQAFVDNPKGFIRF